MKNLLVKLTALVALLTVTGTSYAALKREGEWPESDVKVSLDYAGPRGEALRLVADKAGLSYVAADLPQGNVSLHLKDLPAGKALELVFEDESGSYVATRDGSVIRIRSVSPPSVVALQDAAADPRITPAAPADPRIAPAAPAEVTDHGEEEGSDRVIKGSSLRIEKNEVVHDVSVFGGSVHVYGKVTGDLVVTGGSVHVQEGAWVKGNVTAIGGSLHVRKGARIDGNAGVVGGIMHKEDGAIVKGTITGKSKNASSTNVISGTTSKSFVERSADEISNMVSSFGMLFVFGSIAIALAGERMRKLKLEVATRPMKNFALGILGFLGFVAALIVLCVTVVGIPVALIGGLVGVLAMYAGIVATVTLGGELLLRKRTENPYAHLALGALLFVVLSALPFIGPIVTFAVVSIGVGTLVSTRLAGLAAKKTAAPALGEGPYRTNDV